MWPTPNNDQNLLSLRAGNTSAAITNAAFSREHKCSFWE